MNPHDSPRRQALDLIQISDLESLHSTIDEIARALNALRRLLQPGLPPIDVRAIFSAERKRLVHQELETLEQTNPTLAAQIQEVIDKYCRNFPFDY